MKKTIFISCYGLGIGGIEKCLVNMINNLDMNRYAIDILLMNEELDLKEQIHQKVLFLPSFEYVYNTMETKSAIVKGGVIRYIIFRILNKYGIFPWRIFKPVKKKYDIAIAYSQNDFSAYYVIDKIKADRKLLWYHNGIYEREGLSYKRDKKYYAKFDNVVTVSQSCKQMLDQRFPEIKDKIVILHNFIDDNQIINLSNEPIDPILFSENKISLLTVGRISYEKGPDLAVEACFYLIKQGYNIEWYWVGDGVEKTIIINKIKEYGLENTFHLLGNTNNPYKYMKRCDIYVQPSRYEAFCTTTNEARILSKVIVATKVGGMDEQIADNETGFLVDINIDAICNKIVELIKKPDERIRIENNLQNQQEDFKRYKKEYDNLFDVIS